MRSRGEDGELSGKSDNSNINTERRKVLFLEIKFEISDKRHQCFCLESPRGNVSSFQNQG